MMTPWRLSGTMTPLYACREARTNASVDGRRRRSSKMTNSRSGTRADLEGRRCDQVHLGSEYYRRLLKVWHGRSGRPMSYVLEKRLRQKTRAKTNNQYDFSTPLVPLLSVDRKSVCRWTEWPDTPPTAADGIHQVQTLRLVHAFDVPSHRCRRAVESMSFSYYVFVIRKVVGPTESPAEMNEPIGKRSRTVHRTTPTNLRHERRVEPPNTHR